MLAVPRRVGPGTAGPLGAGDAVLPQVLHGSAPARGASKAAVPGQHWPPKTVAGGDVKAQPLAWQQMGLQPAQASQASEQGGEPAK